MVAPQSKRAVTARISIGCSPAIHGRNEVADNTDKGANTQRPTAKGGEGKFEIRGTKLKILTAEYPENAEGNGKNQQEGAEGTERADLREKYLTTEGTENTEKARKGKSNDVTTKNTQIADGEVRNFGQKRTKVTKGRGH